jgi:asparagine synthase (glutamine-hydrolysing)
MPGITGFVTADMALARHLDGMVASLAVEPEYSTGTYRSLAMGVHVGWAHHRHSHADCAPIWNETRDVCLIFNGETYPDQEELNRLRDGGHAFTAGDASYIVHLYEDQGSSFIAQLNGWFSGILIDLRQSRTILFNDRYGMGRLYLCEEPGSLFFSSHAASILDARPQTRRYDPRGLGEAYSMGCTLQNRTLFDGIALLPPASAWVVGPGGGIVERRTYFDISEWESQEPLSDETFYAELKNTFSAILPRYLRHQESTAMSLTGGLDGRMIMAWARPAPNSLPTYSFSSEYRDPQDVQLAARIAQVCQQTHETISVGREMLAQFPELAGRSVAVSGGAMDVTGAVELYANRRAREIRPIRLTGNYGSEIVRSTVAFKPRGIQPQLLDGALEVSVAAAAEVYRSERSGIGDLRFIVSKQVPWHHHARLSVEQSQLTVRSPYLDNDLVKLMFRASPAVCASRLPSMRLIHDGNPRLTRIPTDRGFRYPGESVADKVRHAWLEFTFKAEYAYDYGMPRTVCRIDNALSALHLERLFLGRHKFYHFRVWYRHHLGSYLRDVLLSPNAAVRNYYRTGSLQRLVEDHIGGRANNTLDIHRALTVEMTHRYLLDSQVPERQAMQRQADQRGRAREGDLLDVDTAA